MKTPWQHIIHQGPCPEIDKLMLYRKGMLDAAGRFEIENHLAGCPICADLLEGIENMTNPDNLPLIEDELKIRLNSILNKKNKRQIPLYIKRLAVAASFLLLLSLSFVVYWATQQKPAQIAMEAELAIKSTEIQDVVTIGVPAPDKKVAQSSKLKKMKLFPSCIVVDDVADEAVFSIASANEFIITESIDTQEQLASKLPERKAVAESKKRMVTGLVVDESGSQMAGVTVRIRGVGSSREKGVVTDVNGKFAIVVDSTDNELQVDFIGYVSEVKKLENDTVKIELQPALMALDEVVVIGYGVKKRKMVTGAVSGVQIAGKSKKPNRAERLNIMRIDYENQLLADSTNVELLSKLASIYIEQKEKQLALELLNMMLLQTTNEAIKQKIIDVIELVEKERFNKALKVLEKN